MKRFLISSALAMLAGCFAVGCGGATKEPSQTPAPAAQNLTAAGLQAGQRVIARLAVKETAKGYEVRAVGIDVEERSTVAGDEVECEDGVTPDGQPCEDDDQGEKEDGDEVECEDGVTPDGQPCEDDDQGEKEDDDDIECENGVAPDGQPCEDDDQGEKGDDDDGPGDRINCATAADCDSDEVCTNGLCTGLPDPCTSAADCDSDEVCANGNCEDGDRVSCASNADCDPDEVCTDGKCDDGEQGEKEDDDDIECEDGVTPDGQPCEDDDQGEKEDGDDHGSKGEHHVDYAKADMIAAPVTNYSSADNPLQIIGIAVNVPSVVAGMAAGNYRFAGSFDKANNVLKTTQVEMTKSAVYRLMTTIEQITPNADGTLTLVLFGKQLIVNANLPVLMKQSLATDVEGDKDGDECEDGATSDGQPCVDDDQGEEDDDDDECEQQGEHEGDNEGC